MSLGPRRHASSTVFSILAVSILAIGCATGEPVEPSGAAGDNGNAGNGGAMGAAGVTGAAGTGAIPTAGTTGSGGNNATAGTSGAAGSSPAGDAGTGGGATGAAGAAAGRGGTTGAAGATAGRGGTTGAAGATAGRGGTTGTAGAAAGRGGTTGAGGARGGTTGTGGARGGTTGSAGNTGSGGAPSSNLCTWPTANGSQSVSATINVSGTYDGGMKRFTGAGALGSSGQNEGQPPMFQISNGGTLQNVILGNPAADGVHCSGSCTLKNVWWEDVGEDAATLQGSSSSQVMTIDTGGAKAASDKIFQHNGPGTMIIKNFCAQDFGKLYRSCGNCSTQYTRHVEMDNIMAMPKLGPLAGINANYNDTAKFTRILIRASSGTICDRYTGNSTGAEPPKIGTGADGTNCIYSSSDITFMP